MILVGGIQLNISIQSFSPDIGWGSDFLLIFFLLGIFAVVRGNKKTRVKKKAVPGERRKQTAETQSDRNQRIQETLAKHFPEGLVCVLDQELKFIFIDGVESGELSKAKRYWIGKTINENFHPSINTGAISIIKQTLNGSEAGYEASTGQHTYSVNVIPVADSKNNFTEILIIIRNLTGMVRLKNNLKKAQQKEKEFNILRTRFVTLASHEFRTPLSTILTSAFLLENYTGDDYETEKSSYIEKIKRAVHNLTYMLNDFLSIGKLEEGKLRPAFSEFGLRPFLEEILQEVIAIRKARQDIAFKFESDSDVVNTDKQLLKNIIMNLLTNAIKYSAPMEEIELEVVLNDNEMKLRVTDNGTGIPEHEQRQIFKRFFRGQNANNIHGTGLGLNLVKKYVGLLRGRIEFTSEVNKGSTFIIHIPTNKG